MAKENKKKKKKIKKEIIDDSALTSGSRRSPRLAAKSKTDEIPSLDLGDSAVARVSKKQKNQVGVAVLKKAQKNDSKVSKKKRKLENNSPMILEKKNLQKKEKPHEESVPLTKKRRKKDSEEESGPEKKRVESTHSEQDGPTWLSLGVTETLSKSLVKRGLTFPFPVQVQTFKACSNNADMVCLAKTGSGKTLAFAIPVVTQILQNEGQSRSRRPGRMPSVLALAPTRELARQVSGEFELLGDPVGLSTFCIYGGVPYGPQQAAIRRGIDILVGTTGRVKDHLEQGSLNVGKVRHVILDEADEMLNMGFAEDVEYILSHVPGIKNKMSSNKKGVEEKDKDDLSTQVLLFSATVPDWVKSISRKYLSASHVNINMTSNDKDKTVRSIRHIAIACHWSQRNAVLGDVISVYGKPGGRTIVFCETKKDCNNLAMENSIGGSAQAIHGDISQSQREITLQGFRDAKFSTLIATDVAARGIDIAGVDLVINCEPPEHHETYVHRAGRTARAGRSGTCVVFYTPKQQWYLNNITSRAGVQFERKGVPQAQELMSAASKNSAELLTQVQDDVIPFFTNTAEELVKEYGAARAVAAALAALSGNFKPVTARSLLTSTPDWVTVEIETKTDVNSLSYIWNLIKRYLFQENCDERVRGMRIRKDSKGAVFDIPEAHRSDVERIRAPGYLQIRICKQLPELAANRLASVRPEKNRPWRRKDGQGVSSSRKGSNSSYRSKPRPQSSAGYGGRRKSF